MNFDMKKYYELGLNELGMNEEQAKAYRARLIATTQGMWHDSAPVDPDAEMVRVGIVYNPITRSYAADYHTEGLDFGSRDELGDALLDCDDLSEPDPDKLITYPVSTSEDEEEADKKRKKKMKTKKKKKIQAPKVEEPKDNTSSPTGMRRDSIETLDDKNLDLSASTASAVPPPPRASKDEKVDKKRKRTKKTKKMKKIQATNLEESKDNTSSPTTMRRDLIETLADKNLNPSASTAPEDEKADKKRTKKTKKKKIQATNLEEPKDNTSSPTRSKSIETLAEENLDPVMHPSDAQFEQRMNQIFSIVLRCDNCRPILEDLLASGTMTEAEGSSILENLIESTSV